MAASAATTSSSGRPARADVRLDADADRRGDAGRLVAVLALAVARFAVVARLADPVRLAAALAPALLDAAAPRGLAPRFADAARVLAVVRLAPALLAFAVALRLVVAPRFAVALGFAVALRFAVERVAGLLAGLRVVDLGCGICSLSLCAHRTRRGYTNRARM
jgi:hypothetical protein